MNKKFKCGKHERARLDKMIKLLMMQGVRPSSTKKLAKVYMPSTFCGLDKTKNMKDLMLGMDN